MRGRFRFAIFLLLLPVLPFLLKQAVEARPGATRASALAAERADLRVELLMGLDLLVRAQRTVRNETAVFSKSLGRVPDVLGALTYFYKIEIARATRDELLVVVTGESRRSDSVAAARPAGDRIAIDERFRVRSNFELPEPPREYLHALAQTVMNRIHAADFTIPRRTELDLWEGVFRDYFRYEVRPVSQGGRTLVATGTRGPVKGDVVEMRPGVSLFDWVYRHRHTTWLNYEVLGQLDKLYLAERIHQDHVGEFAPSLAGVIPNWNDVLSLSGEISPLRIQGFDPDPTLGFQVEVSETSRLSRAPGSERKSRFGLRAWSVNGYGQMSEMSSVEELVSQIEKTKRSLEGHGTLQISPVDTADSPPIKELPRRPLLIDRLESERGI